MSTLGPRTSFSAKLRANSYNLLVLTFILVGFGCNTIHYYVIPEECQLEEIWFDYQFYDIIGEIAFTRTPPSEMDSSSLRSYLDEADELDPFFEFEPDSSLEYYRLVISFGPESSSNELTIIPNNIIVKLHSPFKAYDFVGFNYYRKHARSKNTRARITVEPIGIPKKYTQDLSIEMDLEVRQISDSSIVYTRHVSIPLEFRKKKRMIGSWP